MKNSVKMIKNYTTIINQTIVILILSTSILTGQNIQLTFDNAQNTNDGSNDFYEADIMIQTIGGLADFKVGSGQIYFNYNTLAFGEFVQGNNRIETLQPNNEGYICGQYVDAAAASIYGPFVVNDNTSSRVSWYFGQTFSSSTFASNNITATPTKLFHIKLQYIDVNQEPMVEFEDDNNILNQATDQFFTACGPDIGGPFESVNCTDNPGTQFVGAQFNSDGADLNPLSAPNTSLLENIQVYPNPSTNELYIIGLNEISTVRIYDFSGKIIMELKAHAQGEKINISELSSGMYFLKISNTTGEGIKKIVKL